MTTETALVVLVAITGASFVFLTFLGIIKSINAKSKTRQKEWENFSLYMFIGSIIFGTVVTIIAQFLN